MKKEQSARLTHLSLFSGVGGLDIATHWAGFETIGFCEWADYPHGIMSKRFPLAVGWRDIRTLTKESLYGQTGLSTVDLISGGFPCQPFSCAGQRRGTEDDRYLWPEMLRVINAIRPTFVIGENVAGLLSMAEPVGKPYMESRAINRFEDKDYYKGVFSQKEQILLNDILQNLSDLDYAVQLFVFPACGVNAPHKRDRIAIVAMENVYCIRCGKQGFLYK